MPVIVSLLLHVLLLGSALMFKSADSPKLQGNSNEKGQDSKGKHDGFNSVQVSFLPKPAVVPDKTKRKARQPDPSDGASVRVPHGNDKCPKWYGGVGLTHEVRGMLAKIIIELPKGYPAHVAGVKLGDVILNPYDLKGDPGTPVTIKVSRNGIPLEFKTYRDKICITE